MAAPPAEALGSRDPAGQADWIRRLLAEPWVEELQERTRVRLAAMVRELAYRAGWENHETWPGWERLQEVTGWAERSVARYLAQLRVLGWLAHIERGSTPATRPLALAHVEGNRRAVYALRVPVRPGEQPRAARALLGEPAAQRAAEAPESTDAGDVEPPLAETLVGDPVDKNGSPTGSFRARSCSWEGGSSRAIRNFHISQVRASSEHRNDALRARQDESRSFAFANQVPVMRAQQYAAACALRWEHPVLARLSVRAVRAACRPLWSRGWTGLDVLFALAHRPASWSTLPTMATKRIIAPAAWIASRLDAWRTPRGTVLPPPRIRFAVIAEHGHAADAALPADADALQVSHVRDRGRATASDAADLLARRRQREARDAIEGRDPDVPVATASTRHAARQALAEHTARRTAALAAGIATAKNYLATTPATSTASTAAERARQRRLTKVARRYR